VANEGTVVIRVVASGPAEAARALEAVAQSGAKLHSVVAGGAAAASRELSGLRDTAKRVFEVFTGVNLANVFQQAVVAIKDYVLEASRMAREAEMQQASFMALTKAIGVNGEALAEQLMKASDGLLDIEDAMQAASKALIEGLQPKQIIEMMEAARQLSKLFGGDVKAAFDAFAQAAATGRTRALQMVGIQVDATEAAKKYAAALGVEVDQLTDAQRAQAIHTEAMAKAKPVVDSLTGVNNLHAESVKRLQVAWKETQESFGELLNTVAAAILEWIQKIGREIGTMGPALTELGKIWKATWEGALEVLRPVGTVLEKTIGPTIKETFREIAIIGVGLAAVMVPLANITAFYGSLADDLANGRLPNMTKAFAAGEAAMSAATTRFQEARDALDRFNDSAKGTTESQKELSKLGTNPLGNLPKNAAMSAAEIKKLGEQILKMHVDSAEAIIAESTRALEAEVEITNKARQHEQQMLALSDAEWVAHIDARLALLHESQMAEVEINNRARAEEAKTLAMSDAQWVQHAENVQQALHDEQMAIVDITNAARAVDAVFTSINLQSQLLGPSFDALGASLDAVRARMLAVANAAGGITPEVVRLKAEFDRLSDLANARDFWRDIFGSITQGIDQVVKGLQQGTLTWKSFGDIAMQVINSIAAELINRLLKRAIEPVIDALISVFTGSARLATSGGGAVAAALGGGGVTMTDPLGEGTFTLGGAGLAGGTDVMALAGFGNTLIGIGGKLVTVFDSVVAAGQTFALALRSGGTLGEAFNAAGVAANVGKMSTAAASFTAVAAAVGIALTAMRKDITDAGKAVQSALLAAAAAAAIFGGPYGWLAAAGLAITGFVLEFTGVFSKASERWLSFSTRLSETLTKEGEAVTAFGNQLSEAVDLAGVAKSIEDFRHSIEDQAGVGGFFAATAGLGPFQVPGIPGATGTQHEGGLAFNFGPFIDQFQAGINTMLDAMRNTISVEFADAARKALPDDVAAAFVNGPIKAIREEFERLVSSASATAEDIKKFEESLPAIGERLTQLAGLASLIDGFIGDAAKLALGGIAEAFAANLVAPLRQKLVELAGNANTTKEELEALTKEIAAVAALSQQYVRLGATIAAMSLDMNTRMEGALQAIRLSMALATQAVQDATSRWAEAMTSEELATAGAALEKAILEKYALEKRLVQEIQAEIDRLLDTFGSNFLSNAITSALTSLDIGNAGPIGTLVTMLNHVATSAENASVRLFAAAAALQAITAALPALFAKLAGLAPGQGGSSAQMLSEGIGIAVQAAIPALTTFGTMFNEAKASGNLEGALQILQTGAASLTNLANGLIAGVEAWRTASLNAARANTEALIRMEQERADQAIAAARAAADAAMEANRLQIEANNLEMDALREQRRTIEENIRLSREWARVVEDIDKMIADLKLGGTSPLGPADRLAFALSNVRAAEAAFAANATPENAAAVQQAIQAALAAGTDVMRRPGPKWEAFFDEMVGKLEAVKAAAAARVTPEESAAASLQSIDEQIAALTEANKGLEAMNREIERNTADAVRAIEQQRDANIEAIRAAEAAQVAAINAAADKEIEGIKKGLAEALALIATEQAALTGILLERQNQLMREVTGGDSPLAFLARIQKDAYDALVIIRDRLTDIFNTIPQHALGTDYTPGGLAMLHRGEAVLNPEDAEVWRGMKSDGGGTVLAPMAAPSASSGDVHVTFTVAPGAFVGAKSDEEMYQKFLARVERDFRSGGRLYEVVMEKTGHHKGSRR
jgi:hypothetical protein